LRTGRPDDDYTIGDDDWVGEADLVARAKDRRDLATPGPAVVP
jgi:hypothetical protein